MVADVYFPRVLAALARALKGICRKLKWRERSVRDLR